MPARVPLVEDDAAMVLQSHRELTAVAVPGGGGGSEADLPPRDQPTTAEDGR